MYFLSLGAYSHLTFTKSGHKPTQGRGTCSVKCAASARSVRRQRQARQENVKGDFYVDHTCIDCDTCRWMAPDIFDRVGKQSAVIKQPENPERRKRAMQALIACPTYSIHMKEQEEWELLKERTSIPILVDGCNTIYHNAYHAKNTFGASSWLFSREKQKMVMFDVPRFDLFLVKRIEDMGGLEFIVISHRDDVGDHQKWADHFKAKRIIHKAEIGSWIREAEILLEGSGPWFVGDQEEYEIIHVPGHTEGSIVLYHKPERVLFTGDHLAFSGRQQRLTVFPMYNWFGLDAQLDSVAKLQNLDVKWILPGHGRPIQFSSKQEYQDSVQSFLASQGYQGK